MGAARHSRHNLVSLACLFIVGVTPGCTIPHPPPIPADLSEARVAYGSNVLSKTRFARYPELNFITDLHYGRFGNGAEGELAVVGTSGAAFVGLQGPIHRTTHFAVRAFDRVALVQSKDGEVPLFLHRGSWVAKLHLFDENGGVRWDFGTFWVSGIDYAAAGDLYGNGKLEFVVGLNGAGGIYLLDENGREIWKKSGANVWHVEIASAEPGAEGRVVNSDAGGALTIRDPEGNVLQTFRPVQYVTSFGLARWANEPKARHLMVPDKDAIVFLDLNGQETARLEAPGCTTMPHEILGVSICFSLRDCYQATLVNYKVWNRAVLYLDDLNGKLVYKEVFVRQCESLGTIPVALHKNAGNLLAGCGDEVFEYTKRQ